MKRTIGLILASLTLLASYSHASNCGEIEFVPSREERELLKTLQDKEKASSVATGLIVWAPVVNVLAGNVPEAALNVTMHDWEKWAKTPGNMQKILRCSQVRAIDFYLIEGASSSSGYSSSGPSGILCVRS